MPTIDIKLQCPLHDSFRVQQVLGMFDLKPESKLTERFTVEVPGRDEDWNIGVIVGPSGSGKTAIARAAFGSALYRGGVWAADRAMIDCMGAYPIRRITQMLSAVGFSSPPSWIKPYAFLSNGEKFRCDLARALLRAQGKSLEGGRPRPPVCSGTTGPADVDIRPPARQTPMEGGRPRPPLSTSATAAADGDVRPPTGGLVVFDEFTSVVDRTVARIGSAAVSRAIRGGKIDCRFVAVTCHYDVVNWIEPDWVIDMASGTLAWGRLRRPAIRLDIRKSHRELWTLFRRHHYLSGELHPGAACFTGYVDGNPAAFCAVLPFPHPTRPGWREHRMVCLPDFQGVGIGGALSAFVASLYVATGKPYFSTSGHPAVIAHRMGSHLWRTIRKPGLSKPAGRTSSAATMHAEANLRLTAGFEYTGPARVAEARNLGVLKT